MAQPSLTSEGISEIPPFRSATDFPIRPKPERLPLLYPELIQALKDANGARQMLRARMDEKKQIILQARNEIEQLENDLGIEAKTRLKLHAMNEHLLGVLREIEDLAEETVQVTKDAHHTPRSRLRALIEQLKTLMRHWRALKHRRRDEILPPEEEQRDD